MRTAAIDMPLHQGRRPSRPCACSTSCQAGSWRLGRRHRGRHQALPSSAPGLVEEDQPCASERRRRRPSWERRGVAPSVINRRRLISNSSPPPPPTRPPHGARHQLAGMLLLDLNFLDRREAIPDLNTARTLVQWNFSDQGRSLGRSRWVLVGREVEGEDEQIRRPSLVVNDRSMAGFGRSPRADAVRQLSGGTGRGRRSEPTAT